MEQRIGGRDPIQNRGVGTMAGKNARGWMMINGALICALICVAIAGSQASDAPAVAQGTTPIVIAGWDREAAPCTLEVISDGCCPISVSLPISSQLEVDGEPDFNDPCMAPGDEGDIYFTVNNTGCIGGDVGFHIVDLVDDDEDIVEPEDMVDGVRDGSDGTPYGDLSRNVDMIISADFGEGYEPFLDGKLYDLNCTKQVFGQLDAEDSVSVWIHWWISGEVGNIIMTDSSTFDVEFSLEHVETVLAGGNNTFTVDCSANVTVTADDSDDFCQFESWSDGGAKSHVVYMDGDKTVTANCVECIPGDANEDGVVDMGDVTTIELMILGYITEPTCGADANQDGTIDMGDVTTTELIILGYWPPE